MELIRRKTLPQGLLGQPIDYALKRWEALNRFVENGTLEIDNNLIENSIRPSAVGKRSWLFIGHSEAGERSAIIYALLGSCQRYGINPFDYLKDLFTRLPAAKITHQGFHVGGEGEGQRQGKADCSGCVSRFVTGKTQELVFKVRPVLPNRIPPKSSKASGASLKRAIVKVFSYYGQTEDACPKRTDAPPSGMAPADCAEVGTGAAADEVAEHIDHVEPAACRWVDAVNTGLVGDVGHLDSQIHENHADDETGNMLTDDSHQNEGKHAEP
jgi:hypothetical protein